MWQNNGLRRSRPVLSLSMRKISGAPLEDYQVVMWNRSHFFLLVAAEILAHKVIQGIHHISKRTAKNIEVLPQKDHSSTGNRIENNNAWLCWPDKKKPKKEALL